MPRVALVVWLLGIMATSPLMADPTTQRLAAATKSSVEENDRWLRGAEAELLSAFRTAIDEIDGQSLDGELRSLAALKHLVPALRKEAERIANATAGTAEALKAYREELVAARPVMRAGADELRQYAGQNKFSDITELYRTSADVLDSLARRFEERESELHREAQVINELQPYVREVSLFLERLDDRLRNIPDIKAGEASEEFLFHLKTYVKTFQSFRHELQRFHESLESTKHPDTKARIKQPASKPNLSARPIAGARR